MPRNAMISIRMPDETLEQLEATAEARGETRSALTQRYIDEGLRMDRHPGIVFRPGPAGRRPGMAGGPDVWEVVQVVRNVEPRGDRAIAEAASWLGLAATQVRIAMDYYADYPAEIDAWMAKVDTQAAAAEELFRRRQEVLR
jgi:predicted transcriptional regulator